MNIAKEAMKRQFNKKRQNLQGLKARNNVWLKAKNIHSNRPSQRSWTGKYMDLLGFQKTLVKKHFSWNFQKNG